MINAVLLDLDDTLLDNDVNIFVPTYMHRLSEYMSGYVPPNRFIGELIAGTRCMLENEDPTKTLEMAFGEHFFPAVGLDQAASRPIFERFYLEEFPKLREFTSVRRGARDLIEHIQRRGWDIVIATNPLFPRMAIEERLRWAGVPAEKYGFTLVSSYETCHFTKPKMSYFAEILGYLGRSPAEAIMAGDDPENDLLPASMMGMQVFHVSEVMDPDRPDVVQEGIMAGDGAANDLPPASGIDLQIFHDREGTDPGFPGGTLEALIPWLDQASTRDQDRARTPQILLSLLAGNLAAARGMFSSLPEHAWSRRPLPQEWAPVEVICHLRDLEESIHLSRLQAILNQNEPHLQAVDTHRWAAERDYLHQSGPDALEAFTRNRLRLLEALSNLEEADWHSPATHTIFGPTNLIELISIAADHDTLHLGQLRKSLS
jgi:FMN phosphatase YigB (HAD superfamily)